ncbi:hypothetical protein F4818DRAFT_424956 [Hypoxylon cercidicola]|nr:hypothetical protein F4818DRAFT_424956 [Hypoxylon cercidicola]
MAAYVTVYTMNTSDRIGIDVRRVSSHHQHSVSQRSKSSSPLPHLCPKYSKDGTVYYHHPLGYHGKSVDDHGEGSDSGRGTVRSRVPSSSRGPEDDHPPPPGSIASSSGLSTIISAELKVSLAVKHLATQISESKTFWTTFQEKFEKEVAEIKYFAGDNIMRQLWQKKIEYDSEFMIDETQIHQQFSFQQMKLEACMDQVNNAAATFAECLPQKSHSNHDSRQLALDKIQAAGALVLKLAARSAFNNAACADLVTEASNLEKLVDPQSPEARILHRFDRHETKKPTLGDDNSAEPSSQEPDSTDQDMLEGLVVNATD